VCDRCIGKKNKPKSKNKTDWHFARARSAFSYEGAVVDLVLRLKYGVEGDVARFAAPYLAEVVRASEIVADIIIPVPLSPKRAKERGYNQAEVLAQEVAKLLGVEVAENAMIRVRETAAQKKMTVAERLENLRGAFEVTPEGRATLKGKRVLLVDDVLTTGVTADECARILAKAKAKSVEVLTLASVKQTW
jgi:ComF family protein